MSQRIVRLVAALFAALIIGGGLASFAANQRAAGNVEAVPVELGWPFCFNCPNGDPPPTGDCLTCL